MNTINQAVKILLLALSFGFGITGGFADTQSHTIQSHIASYSNSSNLIAYSTLKPSVQHFSDAKRLGSSSNNQLNQQLTASCVYIHQKPKPLSIYRDRLCSEHDSATGNSDSQLADAPKSRIIF